MYTYEESMTVFELVERLGGEIIRSQARYRGPDGYVVLGKLNGDRMEFTEAGRLLAAEHAGKRTVEREAKASTAPRKTKKAPPETFDGFESLSPK